MRNLTINAEFACYKIIPKYARDYLNICLIFNKYMPYTCPIYDQDINKILSRYDQDMIKIYTGYLPRSVLNDTAGQ